MKKLWKQEKYRRAQERQRHRIEAQRQREKQGVQRRRRRSVARPQVRTLAAPREFSLAESPDETLKFLNDLRRFLPIRQIRLGIDLRQVARIEPEAVAAFVAVMKSAKKRNVTGNVPTDQECKQRLNDFGFFECVKGGPNLGTPTGTIRLLHNGRNVDGTIANDIIRFALQKLGRWEQKKHGPTYTLFTEAMANTFQHADRHKPGTKNWWAGVYYDAEKQAACFTSVDIGIGILKSFSFRQKWKSQSWKSFRTRENQGEILRKLLDGEIPSRTGEKHRGRGLPNMKMANDRNRIQNLMIVSNGAHAHVGHNNYTQLSAEFSGTIIYWEVPRGG